MTGSLPPDAGSDPDAGLESFPGRPLSEALGAPLAPDRFLAVAIPLAWAVARMHRSGLIHRDLKPVNVLVDPASHAVRLTGYGLAIRAALEPAAVRTAGRIEGTLTSMAPEQTGRLNRPVDHRADLYALGVIFYEMLTGALPCVGEDAAALIHCHLARRPEPPARLVAGLAAPLSDLVLKLLAKAPEDRYQAAAGVAADLARCLQLLETHGMIAAFPLGLHDVPERFALPRRLYGRAHEQADLLAAFDAVVDDGRTRGLLLGGVAGVGKSSLVEELRLPIAQRHGHLAAGKFAGPVRDVPFAAITQALRELTAQILAEPEARVASWRAAVLAALPETARLVTDLVPELTALIGQQPAVPPLPPADARHRFALTIRRFLGAIAQPDRPLVLFFDDLQWSDPADHVLIADLLIDPELRHVLIIGAYRSSEMGPDDPLWQEMERVREAAVVVRTLTLGPIAVADLAGLLGDAFRAEGPEVAALAALVHEKTAGNPFFARRLIGDLHDEGLIRFEPTEGAWRWDLARIRRRAIADNVAEMLIGQLRQLAQPDREALGLAACLGHEATLTELATVAGCDDQATSLALEAASQRGLVVHVGTSITFTHDRIREAAVELVSAARCTEANLVLGRSLLARDDATLELRLFEAARRMNTGAALIDDPDERERAASVNLRAGRRAKNAAAFDAARGYLVAGLDFLKPDAWATQPAATTALRLELAEVDALLGRFDDAERTLDEVRGRATERLDRAAAELIAIELRIRSGDLAGALEAVHLGLATLGHPLPAKPDEGHVAAEIRRALAALGERSDLAVLALPPVCDPAIEMTMALLAAALPVAYFTHPAMHDLIGVRIARLSLEHGLGGPSGVGLVLLGMALGVHQGRYLEGDRFARLAIALAEQRGADAYQGKVFSIAASFVSFWVRPFEEDFALLLRARAAALEAGDAAYRCYIASQQAFVLLLTGAPLADVQRQAVRLAEEGRRIGFAAMAPVVDTLRHYLATLTGEPSDFAGPPALTLPFTHALDQILRLEARFLLDDVDGALAAAEAAKPLLWAVAAQKPLIIYHVYRALALARSLDAPGGADRAARLAELGEIAARLGSWAGNCPANFAARHDLVAAELARHEGRDVDAMRGFERAIAAARGQHDLQLELVGHLLASRHYRSLGLALPAAAGQAAARRAAERWGAHALVARLGAPSEREPGGADHRTTVSLPADHLDVLAVVKASHVLAGEIVLDRLAEALMTIMLEQAGAERGWLFRARGESLVLIAEADAGPAIAVRLQPGPAAVPQAIIDVARRTRQPVAVDDPAAEGRFAGDPYFASHRPRAVLCLPMVRQGQLAGLLYLENNLTPGAFSAEKLTVLELLAAQAAISLENARIYEAEAERARVEAREAATRAELTAARELDTAKDAFINAVSHDLRAPVTAIMGYAEFLEDGLGGPLSADQANFTAQILHAATRLGNMLEDLLDIARLEAGTFTLRPEPMDVAAKVEEIVASFVPQLQAERITLESDLARPIEGRWDPARLGQVLTNLIGNAVKFTPAGGRIRVRATMAGDRLRCEVTDSGAGIAAEDIPKLFRRFSQLEAGVRKGGTGIGLSIVKALVEAHGGIIGVESEQGRGSTFWFELPRETPVQAD